MAAEDSQRKVLGLPCVLFFSKETEMIHRLLLFLFSAALFLPSDCQGQVTSNAMVSVPYKGKKYVGRPLAWDGKELALFRRDGRISQLPASDLKKLKVVEGRYKPFGKDEMIAQLRIEFGGKYQVSPTSNFIVVHPPGSARKWAQPFQDLYFRFKVYFESRGVELEEPPAPLVAIVLKTRREYDRFIKDYQPGLEYSSGYYSSRSNRIVTYDHSDQGKRQSSEDTLVHEATHQTAYNTGIHRRFGNTPRWLGEGLAQLFEAKGINNSRRYGDLSDRINKQALRQLMDLYKKEQVAGAVQQLVRKDSMFRTDIKKAYAVSWGISLYLAEKYPRKYVAYLAYDGDRKAFRPHSEMQRAKDFAKFFGTDFTDFDARMKIFFTALAKKHKSSVDG